MPDTRTTRQAQAIRQRRAALQAARDPGLIERYRAKLTHISTPEQHGARLALAALNREHDTIVRLLEYAPTGTVRQSAAVALGALAELALTARPGNLTKARDALARIEASGPDQPTPAA